MPKIRAVALDVDGTLTDGKFGWDLEGGEFKQFSFLDVMGISRAKKAGITFALISGENSPLVTRFAEKMGIRDVHLGCKQKAAALEQFVAAHELLADEVCYMGDDVNDLPAMLLTGLSAAPANAAPSVRSAVHIVTQAAGGNGAVRELLDFIVCGFVSASDEPLQNLLRETRIALATKDNALAEQLFNRAAQVVPNTAAFHAQFGTAFLENFQLDAARTCFQRSLQLEPSSALALTGLGKTLFLSGSVDQALAMFQQALTASPQFAPAHLAKVRPFARQGRFAEAFASFERVAQLDGDLVAQEGSELFCDLAMSFANHSLFTEAQACIEEAKKYGDGKPGATRLVSQAINHVGLSFQHSGRLREAISCFRDCLALNPHQASAGTNLFWCLQYSDEVTAETARAEAEAWATARFPASMARNSQPKLHPRLRIGYLTPEFREHPLAYVVERLLENRNRDQFETFLYASTPNPDGMSGRLERLTDNWRNIASLSDEAAADLIENDEIDILLDLAGHTENNRIGIFARKPAPVQALALGYYGTTGLTQMDWILGDSRWLPEAEEHHFVERVQRLAHNTTAVLPPTHGIEVSPLPAKASGFITFGCHNYLAKVNEAVVRQWSEVLKAVPGSRMKINRHALGHESNRRRILDMFLRNGIDASRVELQFTMTREQYLKSLSELDIFLDTFPFNGSTSTYEALLMGLPVVTLSKPRMVGHFSDSVLIPLGFERWVAKDSAEYVAIATRLASDLTALEQLRKSLRQSVTESTHIDPASAMSDMEAAYLAMWADYESRQLRPQLTVTDKCLAS